MILTIMDYGQDESSTAIDYILFATIFHSFSNQKSFVKFIVLFTAGILCRSGHTICGYLRILGMKGEKGFSNYHHLLNRCKIDMLKAAKIVTIQVSSFAAQNEPT